LGKKRKKPVDPDELKPAIVVRSPGFSIGFQEDLAWWFKHDFQKASKILDLVTAVMQDLFQGLGQPEPLKYLDTDMWSRRIDLEHRLVYRVGHTQIDVDSLNQESPYLEVGECQFLTCRYHYE
jgi:toxin YoeB